MSRVAVMSVRIATTDEAGQAPAGSVGKVTSFHEIATVTTEDTFGPLAAGSTGFLLKGVEGMVVARVKGTATATPAGESNMNIVLEGETVYMPAPEGGMISLIAVT